MTATSHWDRPNAKPCKNRPRKCKCNPDLWDGWWKVCDKYTYDKWFKDGRCKNCDHDKECHTA